ncbi:hypothetical protein [Gemmobacter sp. 24YEA27]|uniref:hypothetical protein n=1 Tax=Gemmobacter sp. 24YEA27 TaxID=3040672 RepID=UPI0024B39A58|nr:hypothetical protein [Gemmobacter sp. 24YEA27]
MKVRRPFRRVILRRLLIYCLVSACFAVILANRIITSAATEGFEPAFAQASIMRRC